MESTSLDYIKDYNTFITFNVINIQFDKCSLCIEFSICERNIYMNINENKIMNILLDKDKLVVSLNDPFPVLNDCRLGRCILK